MDSSFPYPYTVIRSDRRTLALEINREGNLLVRAPRRCPDSDIQALLAEKQAWIGRHLAQQKQRQAAHPEPNAAQQQQLLAAARSLLPERVAYFSQLMGLRPRAVTITGARTRFGSCSNQGRLSFSWRLMQYPAAAIDYVVVHELAHLRYMDHSPAFYALIATVMPDYQERIKLLRS